MQESALSPSMLFICCIRTYTNLTQIQAILNTFEKETELLKYYMPTMLIGPLINIPI